MVSLEHTVEVAAPAAAVFALVSDLTRMGEFSPENDGGEWLRGASGPALGAKFRGRNGKGRKTWTTTATVSEYDAPHRFAFEVTVGPVKVARWAYVLEETPGGCRVTERWTDRRNGLVRRLPTSSGVEDRVAFTDTSIRDTLSRLKTVAEAG